MARAVERLREGGHVFEQEGATWFRSTTFGDDKDRVIYRTNGEPTYFAADIGYVTEKFARGFDKLIYIWGADHHGTVARVRNAAQAMGFDPDAVEMLLVAWVRFVRDGEEVSMSKRAGEFITLDELLDEVGVDAARWSFAARAASSPIDFDIELARKQSAENPVYYVQYAHARICSILRKATEAGIAPSPSLAGTHRGRPGRAGARTRGAAAAGGRRGRRGGGRRTASRPTRPSSRRRSTPTTGTGASWTPTTPSDPRAGWRSSTPRAWHSATPWACWGSRRPRDVTLGRCRAPDQRSAGRGRPRRGARPGRAWSLATRTSTGDGSARDIDTRQHRVHTGQSAIEPRGSRELLRVRDAVPGGLPHDRPGIVRTLEHDQPIAAPAIRGGGHGRLRAAIGHRIRAQLAQGLGVARDQPSPSASATSGSSTLAGRSSGYRSGCRICSVEAGSCSQAALTASQPPLPRRASAKARPASLGKV